MRGNNGSYLCRTTLLALTAAAAMGETAPLERAALCAVEGPRLCRGPAAPAPIAPRVTTLATYGNRGADFAQAMAVAADGSVTVGGRFDGRLELAGTGALDALGSGDIALVGFDAKLQPRWSRSFGGVDHDDVRALASPGNAVAVGGFFIGSAGFSGGEARVATLTTQGGADGFVAFVDRNGLPVASIRVGGKAADHVRTLDVLAHGELLVGGHFQAASRLAPGPSGVVIGAGGTDVFVQCLGADNQVRWARSFGGEGDEELADAAALANGGALLLLRHDRPLPLKIAGQETVITPATGHDALLLWLDADGVIERAVTASSDGNDDLHLLTVLASGQIVLAGEFIGTQSWAVGSSASQTFTSKGSTDVIVFWLDPQGKLTVEHTLASTGPDSADALTVQGNSAWLAVGFQDALALDPDTQVGTVDTSAVLARYEQAGQAAAHLVIEGQGVQKITALAATANDISILGIFEDELRATGIDREIRSRGKSDVFVARVRYAGTMIR